MKRDTLWLLGALLAGITFGMLVARDPGPASDVTAIFEPIGTMWVNAIRMIVIPLVVATVLAALLSAGSEGAVSGLGLRALGWMYVCVLVAVAVSLAVSAVVLPGFDFGGAALPPPAELPATEPGVSSIVRWLVELIPANPVRAAADGAMLALLVFVAIFAIAATRIDRGQRDLIRRGAEAVSATAFVVVRWVLAVAPIGVFALAAVLGVRLGAGALGALLVYVTLVAVLCVLIAGALYLLALFVGRTSLARFAPAAAPAQTVALSARASMPALPAMLDGAARLGLSSEVRNVFLPVAAAVFRMGSAVWMPVAVLILARLYGITIGLPTLLMILAFAPLLTFSVPSVPAGTLLITAPLLAAAGVPAEGLGILLAADTIPDMLRTALNVTGHMSVATVLDRRGSSSRAASPA